MLVISHWMVKVNLGIFVFIPTYIHAGLHFPYIEQNIPLRIEQNNK